MDVEAGLTETDHEHDNNEKAEEYRHGDVGEAEFVTTAVDGELDFKIRVSEDGENQAGLRKTDTSGSDGINDEPRAGEPADFGRDKADDEGDEWGVVFAVLDENVV